MCAGIKTGDLARARGNKECLLQNPVGRAPLPNAARYGAAVGLTLCLTGARNCTRELAGKRKRGKEETPTAEPSV
jgi:hypothetical protein